jgi:hypothetical protein
VQDYGLGSTGTGPAQLGPALGEDDNETSGLIKGRKFVDQLIGRK